MLKFALSALLVLGTASTLAALDNSTMNTLAKCDSACDTFAGGATPTTVNGAPTTSTVLEHRTA
jgi:hypothetical protein